MTEKASRWRKNILVVDDEEIIRRTLCRDVEEMGYAVTAVADGKAAIAALQEHYYDLVLTDLCMEGMSGIEVLKGAKERSSDIGVIILTGFGDITSAIEALRNGADDYLLKPYVYADLALRLGNCLEKQEMKKRLKVYEDFLPICSVCKKIRNDKGKEPGSGQWQSVEEYLQKEAGVLPSHSYCPDCYKEAMQELHSYVSVHKK
ncbi:sigma-54-dependent transcriptional regulator [Thiovibrio frasassiensis]|uniref:Response regulator n=1 Tax=Thiovibrio frasassiensis TaxID=2984131 RepID=A0A9X4MKV2_9BACT|nr:response regulator [Thiovibrio frasassiensis]MDG4476659.1 response regulator [Thiovibrio frasassiensis]